MKFSKFLTIVAASNVCYCSQFYSSQLKSQMIDASLCSMMKYKLKNSKIFNNTHFESSIFIEIPDAIKNCILKQGQFDGIKDIVDFQGTEPRNWTQANWNAVFLYNFLNSVFYLNQNRPSYVLEKEKLKLLDRFGIQFESKLMKAYDDIRIYMEELGLFDWIIEYKKDINKIPYLDVANVDKNGNGFVKMYFNTIGKLQGDLYAVVKDNKLSHYVIEIDGKKYNMKIDKYFNLSDMFVPETNDNFEDSLLDVKQIHPLPNYGGICWFSSGLWALCASRYYREVIKHMNLIWKLEDMKNYIWNYNIAEPVSELIENMMTTEISADTYKDLRTKIDKRYDSFNRYDIYQTEYYELQSIQSSGNITDFDDKLNEFEVRGNINVKNYKGKQPSGEVIDNLLKDVAKYITNKAYVYSELKGYDVSQIIYETLHCYKPKCLSICFPINLMMHVINSCTRIEEYKDICIQLSEQFPVAKQITDIVKARRIIQMPSVLICHIVGFVKGGVNNYIKHVSVPEELFLQDVKLEGGKSKPFKYRLVSTQCSTSSTGGHYLAEIRTKSGWYVVDDRDITPKPMKIDFKTNNTGTNRYRNMLIYERVE